MKTIFERVIAQRNYDLTSMLARIDEYHIAGKLTDAEREALVAQARGVAAPGFDANVEIQRLTADMRKLEARVAELEGRAATDGSGQTGSEDVVEVLAWVQPTGAHDAYFAGDRIAYNGVCYDCVAPSGVACVWSPDVMPGYWQVVSDDA